MPLCGRFHFPKTATVISPPPICSSAMWTSTPLSRGGAYFSIPLNLDGPCGCFLWPIEYDRSDAIAVLDVVLNWPGSFLFLSLGMLAVGTIPLRTSHHTVRTPSHMERPCVGVLADNTRWDPQAQSAHTASYMNRYLRCALQLSLHMNVAPASIWLEPHERPQVRTTQLSLVNHRIMRHNHNSLYYFTYCF